MAVDACAAEGVSASYVRLRCWVKNVCPFCCRELRIGPLVGLEVELCGTRRKRFPDRWGCMLNSLYYTERKFPDRWGCMLSSLYYQVRKIPSHSDLQ